MAYGCDASLVIRSCFTAIPFEKEKLAGPITANSELDVRRGVALTRYLADLGLNTIRKGPRRGTMQGDADSSAVDPYGNAAGQR